jgi:hypothetical protein
MKKIIVLLCLLMISTGAHAKKDRNRVVLDWATMYGVDEAFVGEENPIRGIMGDELPWTIAGGVHGLSRRGSDGSRGDDQRDDGGLPGDALGQLGHRYRPAASSGVRRPDRLHHRRKRGEMVRGDGLLVGVTAGR